MKSVLVATGVAAASLNMAAPLTAQVGNPATPQVGRPMSGTMMGPPAPAEILTATPRAARSVTAQSASVAVVDSSRPHRLSIGAGLHHPRRFGLELEDPVLGLCGTGLHRGSGRLVDACNHGALAISRDPNA